jgi:hypothetical protein
MRQLKVKPQQTCSHRTVCGALQRKSDFVHFSHDARVPYREDSAARTRRGGRLRAELVCGTGRRVRVAPALHRECPSDAGRVGAHRRARAARSQPSAAGQRHRVCERGASSGQLAPGADFAKPFRYVWMTRDLPSNWDPLSPLSDWSALPKSFSSAQFQPRGSPWAAFAGDPDTRYPSNLFCVIRC